MLTRGSQRRSCAHLTCGGMAAIQKVLRPTVYAFSPTQRTEVRGEPVVINLWTRVHICRRHRRARQSRFRERTLPLTARPHERFGQPSDVFANALSRSLRSPPARTRSGRRNLAPSFRAERGGPSRPALEAAEPSEYSRVRIGLRITANTSLAGATCSVLSLELGPLNLNLLGLEVALDDCANGPVTVDMRSRRAVYCRGCRIIRCPSRWWQEPAAGLLVRALANGNRAAATPENAHTACSRRRR